MPSVQTAASDRRKFARLDIALTVAYAITDEAGNPSEYAEAISGDISAGGFRLMTPGPLPNGAILELEISMNGSEESIVHASGEVVWQQKINDQSYETGTVIKYIEEDDKKIFMGFVFDQMSRLVGGPSFNLH